MGGISAFVNRVRLGAVFAVTRKKAQNHFTFIRFDNIGSPIFVAAEQDYPGNGLVYTCRIAVGCDWDYRFVDSSAPVFIHKNKYIV